jgi:hypothetical protein
VARTAMLFAFNWVRFTPSLIETHQTRCCHVERSETSLFLFLCGQSLQNGSEILRFTQNDISHMPLSMMAN